MKYAPYSYSRLKSASCPFAFKRRYIDKIKGTPHGNAEFGTVAHLIVADIIKAHLNEEPYDLTELMKQHVNLGLLPRLGELQALLNLFRERFRFNRDKVVGVEERVAINEDGSSAEWDNSYVRGILDLIEIDGEHATIIDHKTQFNILNDEDMRNHDQLTFYCYLVNCFYPQVNTFTVKIYFARYGFFKTSERTMQDVEKFAQALRVWIHKIEAIEEWIPIPGQGCSVCEFTSVCPLANYDPRGLDAPVITTMDQAVQESRLLRVREEQIKVIKDRLKAFCSEHGPVTVSEDFEFGFVVSESEDWPIEKTLKVFEKHGYNLAEVVSFGKKHMQKILEQAERLDKDFADDLSKTVKKTADTRFTGHKKR